MKKKANCFLVIIMTCIICIYSMYFYFYKSEMNRISIIQEFCGGDDNYQYTYLRIILPEGEYHEQRTLNAIKWNIEHRRGIQNWLRIVIYDDWNSFVNTTEYIDHYFRKDE